MFSKEGWQWSNCWKSWTSSHRERPPSEPANAYLGYSMFTTHELQLVKLSRCEVWTLFSYQKDLLFVVLWVLNHGSWLGCSWIINITRLYPIQSWGRNQDILLSLWCSYSRISPSLHSTNLNFFCYKSTRAQPLLVPLIAYSCYNLLPVAFLTQPIVPNSVNIHPLFQKVLAFKNFLFCL